MFAKYRVLFGSEQAGLSTQDSWAKTNVRVTNLSATSESGE